MTQKSGNFNRNITVRRKSMTRAGFELKAVDSGAFDSRGQTDIVRPFRPASLVCSVQLGSSRGRIFAHAPGNEAWDKPYCPTPLYLYFMVQFRSLNPWR